MTIHLGNMPANITLYIPFSTYGKTNGESITLTGLAVTDIEIYKNGSVTQRSSDAGYALLDTDGIDFDGITGIHGFSIDLSNNTDSGFYSVGGFYWVVVSAVTIDSQTVNFVAATFRIVTAEAITGNPKVDVDAWLGTAASTPTVAGVPNVNVKTWNDLTTVALPLIPTTAGRTLDVSTGGEAGVDWANVGSPTTTVALTGTTIATTQKVDVETIKTNPVVNAGTVTFPTGATLASTTNVTAGTITTVTNLTNAPTSGDLTATMKASVNTEIDTALADVRLDELLAADSDIDGAAPPTVGSVFHELMTKTAGSFTYDQTTDSLEAIRDRGDAAWITATGFSTHSAADVWAVGTRTVTAATNITSDGSAITMSSSGVVGTVNLVNTVTTYTGNTPQTGDSFARLGAPAGASVSADIAVIEAQADDIGAAGAGLTAVPWNAAWDAEVQSEVDDAIVAKFLDKLVLASGTADSGSTTTMVDAARTEADADYWKGRMIRFTSGNIDGQCAIVTDFDAATDTLTFAPALTQAVSTQTYVLLPEISVWDDTLAEHLAAGTTGNALNAAGAAGDPWATALPGAYGAGTAGRLVGRSLPDIVAGSAGGLFLAGSNAATTVASLTVSAATTFTGNVSMAAGLTITQSTADTSAVVITGNGTGDGIRSTGGATGRGVAGIGGGTSGDGIVGTGTVGHGIRGIGVGSSKHGILGNGSVTNGSGICGVGGVGGTGHGLFVQSGSGATGNGIHAESLATNGSGVSFISVGTGSGILTDEITNSGTTTLTGAVSLGSTLGVTGTTTFAAINTGAVAVTTLSSSGTVTLAALTVSGATTLTGTVLATGASNDIRGITVSALSNNVITAAATAADFGAEVADAILDRDMATGTDSGSTTVRTPRQALRFLRNQWTVSAGTLTVYKEDDTTSSWTSAVSSDASADPIVGSNPAGP